MGVMKRNKKLIVVVTILCVIFGGTLAWYVLKKTLIHHFLANFELPAAAVTTTTVKTETWNPTLRAVGSLKAVNGVEVNSDVSGQVTEIYFKSGQMVNKGDPLVQLDDSVDQQTLNTDIAQLSLNTMNFKRQQKLYKKNATSKSALDAAQANMLESQAAVATAKVMIQKKKIKAPFAGKLGIREVDIGQYITPGQSLVLLQSLDPLYVNFDLPEQNIADLHLGQQIVITTDAIANKTFTGSITAINSAVDVSTRSISVQATIPNEDRALYPGLFADVNVKLSQQFNVITIPQNAVAYSLYGDLVYVIKKSKDREGKPDLIAVQKFVKVGDRQGTMVSILEGLEVGEQIVTTGQLKLHNGSRVVINNTIQLKNDGN